MKTEGCRNIAEYCIASKYVTASKQSLQPRWKASSQEKFMIKEGCELIAVSESDVIIPYKCNIVNIKTAVILT